MKNRYLIYFILTGYVLGSFLGLISHDVLGATTLITLSKWDDVASGLDDGISGFIQFTHTGDANYFETSSSNYVTAPNSFGVLSAKSGSTYTGSGYWNLTNDYDYIKIINLSFIFQSNGIGTGYIYFYDYLNNPVIKINFSMATTSYEAIYWYDISSGYRSIYTVSSFLNQRAYLLITHNGTNHFNIKLYNSTFYTLADKDFAGATTSNFTNFSYCYLSTSTSSASSYNRVYYDNFYITQEVITPSNTNTEELSGYEIGQPSCGILSYSPVMGYLILGNNVKDCPIYNPIGGGTVYSSYIEVQHPINLNAKIFYIDLYVSFSQYQMISSSLSDYMLYVNGINVGYPIAWINSSGNKILRWYFENGISLEDEQPLFEFYSAKSHYFGSDYGITHWFIGFTNNQCGYLAYKHNASSLFGNNELTGVHLNNPIYLDPVHWGMWQNNYVSPYVKYYYTLESFVNPEESLPDNVIITIKENKAYFSVTVSDINSSVHIYNITSGVEQTDYNFPINHNGLGSFECMYRFNQTGDYNVTIERDGINVFSSDFEIITLLNNYDVWTVPRPSTINEQVIIYYIYNPLHNENGRIVISKSPYYNNSEAIYDTFNIEDNNGSISYVTESFYDTGIFYLFLLRYITGYGWEKTYSYIHPVKSNIDYINSISVKYETMDLSVNNVQTIYYTHNNVGSPNIKILLNNKEIYAPISYNNGSFNINISKPTHYSVKLVLTNGIDIIVLAQTNFTVVETEPSETPKGLFYIEPPFSYFAGVFIIVLFTLTPIFFGYLFKIDLDKIPQFLYLVFALIGFVVSILLGFFPIWTIAVLVIVSALIITIMWLQRKMV